MTDVPHESAIKVPRIDSGPPTLKEALVRELEFTADREAILRMGFFYEEAKYVSFSTGSADQFFGAAAALGDTQATVALARVFLRDKHYKNGHEILCLPDIAESPAGQLLIAITLQFGLGVPADTHAAVKIYERLAATNDEALTRLQVCVRDGVGCERDLNRYSELLQRGIDRHIASSWYRMGLVLESNAFDDNIPAESVTHYVKAAQLGDVDAATRCGEFLVRGLGTEKDVQRGIDFLSIGAAANRPRAKSALARMLAIGRDVCKDDDNMLHLCFQAAASDETDGCLLMSQLYRKGRALKKNETRARHWEGKALDYA